MLDNAVGSTFPVKECTQLGVDVRVLFHSRGEF
jgi:hypothetical protein